MKQDNSSSPQGAGHAPRLSPTEGEAPSAVLTYHQKQVLLFLTWSSLQTEQTQEGSWMNCSESFPERKMGAKE